MTMTFIIGEKAVMNRHGVRSVVTVTGETENYYKVGQRLYKKSTGAERGGEGRLSPYVEGIEVSIERENKARELDRAKRELNRLIQEHSREERHESDRKEFGAAELFFRIEPSQYGKLAKVGFGATAFLRVELEKCWVYGSEGQAWKIEGAKVERESFSDWSLLSVTQQKDLYATAFAIAEQFNEETESERMARKGSIRNGRLENIARLQKQVGVTTVTLRPVEVK